MNRPRARIVSASSRVDAAAALLAMPLPDANLEQLARLMDRVYTAYEVYIAVVDGLPEPAGTEFRLRAAGVPSALFGDAVAVVVHATTRELIERHSPDALQAIEEAHSAYSGPPRNLIFGGRVLAFSQRAHVMGIVNVTPDSFSDGGRYADHDAAIKHALRLVEEGADVLDIGGESTRPGADPVDADEEARRVVPVIETLAAETTVAISIDTTKASVARAALDAGASIVNDVSAGRFDPELLDLVTERSVPVVLMHMLGEPRTMQRDPRYGDVVGDVWRFLAERAEAAEKAGVSPERILVDPGFGFGKTREHNLVLLKRLRELTCLGYPVLVGTSRKAFIGMTLDLPVDERLEGTAATVALAVANGAAVVRVHDVSAMRRVANMVQAVNRATGTGDS